jgi:hypothetical protein
MHHKARTGWRTVQQIRGRIVGKIFSLALDVVLAGDNASSGVVVQQLALVSVFFPVTLQAADQVIGRVIVEVFLLGSWQLRGLAIGAAYP